MTNTATYRGTGLELHKEFPDDERNVLPVLFRVETV